MYRIKESMANKELVCDCNKQYKSEAWFKKHIAGCNIYHTNWVVIKNKSKLPKVSFNSKYKFSYDEKREIINMLSELYYINDKFKSLCFDNSYTNIAIVKPIHTDTRDFHFNGFLYRNDKRTNILHFYINHNSEIYKITELVDLI